MALLPKHINLYFSVLAIFFVCIWQCSCISPKKVVYLSNLPDTIGTSHPYVMTDVTKYQDPVIQTNDLLSITVQTMAQNQSNTPISSTTVGVFQPVNAFLVDKNGNIEMSLIGFVKVAGLTTSEARELIKEKAKEYFVEPVVNLKITNFDIYLLGDAGAHTISVFHEKINILDAIALSGDLQITGKRKNILLIRTEGDTKKFVRYDLTDANIFHSPYFYLHQRDILYVEPNKYKIQLSDNTLVRNIGIFTTVISFGTLLLALRNVQL